ncbi:MAG: hypothetical protein RIS56_1217 [Verrucomicrobiota bacterium]|jgi:hypothetical protein
MNRSLLVSYIVLFLSGVLVFGQSTSTEMVAAPKVFQEDELDAKVSLTGASISGTASRVVKASLGAKIDFRIVIGPDGKVQEAVVTHSQVYFREPGKPLDTEAAELLRKEGALDRNFNYSDLAEVEKKVTELFVRAATEGIKTWRYTPGKKNGVAVSFQLKNGSYNFRVNPNLPPR